MFDAFAKFLARVQDGVMHNAAPSAPLAPALGKLLFVVLGLLVTRLVAKSAPRLDALITRYERQLLFFAAVGVVAYFMGEVAVMLTVAAGAGLTVWWLERRRRRNPHEKKDTRRRAVTMSTAVVLLLAAGAGAAQYQIGQMTRRMTRFCLLLSFKPTSASTAPAIESWMNFASTWKEVFSGVEGVTISPDSATSDDFNKFSSDALVRSLKPDLVLKTTVYIPEKSINLLSRVYSSSEMNRAVATFEWKGSLEEIQHTALRGAAHLLRHLHTTTARPLADTPHGQAAKNLLNVYLVFLRLHQADDVAAEVQRTLDGTAPITDDQIDALLDRFDISPAVDHDAKREAEARADGLSRLPR